MQADNPFIYPFAHTHLTFTCRWCIVSLLLLLSLHTPHLLESRRISVEHTLTPASRLPTKIDHLTETEFYFYFLNDFFDVSHTHIQFFYRLCFEIECMCMRERERESHYMLDALISTNKRKTNIECVFVFGCIDTHTHTPLNVQRRAICP